MEITVTYEDKDTTDLFVQHMAEQEHSGHVVDWIQGLIFDALQKHPDYRECKDPDCMAIVYPFLEARPVENRSWKRYRVVTRPCETCPACGGPTVKIVESLWRPTVWSFNTSPETATSPRKC